MRITCPVHKLVDRATGYANSNIARRNVLRYLVEKMGLILRS